MHEERGSAEARGHPSAPPCESSGPHVEVEGEYLPPEEQPRRRRGGGWGGGALVGLGLLLAKFKGVLALLLSFKWLLLAPKLLLSFGTLFASIWFYALFFGWKFGIVFVLLILVHELGHYLTFRNFGIAATLPFFIPGFGAFVSRRGPAPSLAIDATATLAGPIFGLGAAGVCYGYAISTGEPFWYAAAYVGFFLNALNLLPIPPFDGGGIAAAIDPRLWILGAIGLFAWLLFFATWGPFTVLMVLLIALVAIPRIMALRRGIVDPRFADVDLRTRITIAAAYFVTVAVAVAGTVATHIDVSTQGHG